MSKKTRIKSSMSLSERLAIIQHGRCFYCQYPVSKNGSEHSRPWSIDHVVPRSKISESSANKVLACVPCNNEKGDSLPSYRSLIRLFAINLRLGTPPREDLMLYAVEGPWVYMNRKEVWRRHRG